MSRGPRQAPGGCVYHVLNRAVARLPLFEKPADYEAFLRVLAEALEQQPMRILAFILMPNHWHFVLWPEGDRDLSDFCRWLAHTHSMRWHAHYHTSGSGHIYQGRYKKAPAMFKNAPAGGLNKRGRADPIDNANALLTHFDPLH